MSNESCEPECISCKSLLQNDHTGIKCLQGHNICPTCSVNFVKVIFENPYHNIPVKCMMCRTEIPTIVFERQLKPKELEIYNIVRIKCSLGKDEATKGCPFCSYFEVWPKKNEMNFFFCKGEGCQKMSCTVCHKFIQKINDGYEKEENKYTEIEKLATDHFECMELSEYLGQFEKVIDDGEKMYCPGCGVGGRKDDGCTHMICNGCQTVWCYMCGLDVNKCDKSKPDGTIYHHNENWEINPKRCPMYFFSIQDKDKAWPSSDEDCLVLFHRWKTLGLLKQYATKIGVPLYTKLMAKFTSVSSCGYPLEDILKDSVPLFNR